jgi:putative FmdB family regulatory protein
LPTYGYRCRKCANEFDVLQRMTDPPGAACPKCGSASQRLFFPASIVFKGSGFYATDNRASSSSSSSASSSDGAGSTAPANAGAEPKTDTPKGETKKSEKPTTPSSKTSSAPDKSS